jgi:hypothetical protein
MGGEDPSGEAMTHVRSCAECARVFSKENSLNRLLKSTQRVVTPLDFDSSVMSEISARQSAGGQGVLGLRPAVFVPAAAVLVFAVILFGLYGSGLFTSGDGPAVAGPPVNEARESDVPVGIESTAPTDPSSPDAEPQVAAVPADEKTVDPSRSVDPKDRAPRDLEEKREADDTAPGSRDLATRSADPVVPPWAGVGKDPKEAEGGPVKRSFSPREVFEMFGVEADYGESGWKVTSVRPKGLGANAGLLQGDVLKSLDGKPLTEEPLEGSAVGGKRLVVLRGGKEIALSLRPGN